MKFSPIPNFDGFSANISLSFWEETKVFETLNDVDRDFVQAVNEFELVFRECSQL